MTVPSARSVVELFRPQKHESRSSLIDRAIAAERGGQAEEAFALMLDASKRTLTPHQMDIVGRFFFRHKEFKKAASFISRALFDSAGAVGDDLTLAKALKRAKMEAPLNSLIETWKERPDLESERLNFVRTYVSANAAQSLKAATAAEKAGDIDTARQIMATVYRFSEEPKAIEGVGKFFYRRGDLGTSVEALGRARELSKGKAGCAATLVKALMRLNRTTEAEAIAKELEGKKGLSEPEQRVVDDYKAARTVRLLDQARLSLENDDLDKAGKAIRSYLGFDPKSEEGLKLAAEIEMASSNWSVAADHLLALFRSTKMQPATCGMLITALRNSDRRADLASIAEPLFQNAKLTSDLEKSVADFAAKGKPDEHSTQIISVLQRLGKDPETLETVGKFFYRRGDLGTAAEVLERARSRSKGKFGCATTLVAALTRMGKKAEVAAIIKDLEGLKTLSESDKKVVEDFHEAEALRLTKQARAEFRDGDSKKALKTLSGSLSLAPHNTDSIRLVAEIEASLGNWSGASKSWLKLFDAGGLNAKDYNSLITSLRNADDQKGLSRVVEQLCLETGLNPETRMTIAEILAKGALNDRGRALALFEAALGDVKQPRRYDARYGQHLIRCAIAELRAKKDLGKAKYLFEKGSELCTPADDQLMRFGQIRGELGKQLAEKQRISEAVIELEAAIALTSDNAEYKKLLADVQPKPVAAPVQATAPVTNDAKGRALLAKANEAAKQDDELENARELYERAIPLLKNAEKAKSNLANTLIKLAQSKDDDHEEDAVALLARAVEVQPTNYRVLMRAANFFVKAERIDEAYALLKTARENANGEKTYLGPLGTVLARMHRHEEAYKILEEALAAEPDKALAHLTRLADVAAAMQQFDKAAQHYEAINSLSDDTRANANNNRRIHLLNLRQGKFSAQDKERLDVCKTFFDKNQPKLDEEQQRILGELIDKGICMSDFDSLFGKKHQDLWDAAEAHVKSFTEDPEVRALEQRISQCEDFNADPEFAKSFKPSIVNYRMLKGEMYATEAAYQMYLNKRVLDIANSYNEMLSKIRNVALWLNPPIGGKNIGERKGSQIWHRDQEDENILKCFIYYTDVEEGCGPTEYIRYSKVKPERKYSKVIGYPQSSGYPGSYLIDKHVQQEDMLSAIGKKKSIMFFDTNGFHRGGYVTKDRRIITMATFLRPITPYADTNTKLSLEGFDEKAYPFEASYGVAP
ncbi:tetratricopeptide repeat protein [Pseudahrensia aquimaris]|uniref:Tetratricopeptide repeat protein n=1 Tax=Pseudahrensia aquimaris TaxID=744461 RepID=A0ABW3FE59_9HYPH